MKRLVVSVLVAAMVSALGGAGCAAETSGQVCDPSGNWQDTSKRTGGDCASRPTENDPGTFTMRRDEAGRWQFNPDNYGFCSGTMNANCRFVASCEFTLVDQTTKKSELGARFSVDYTFAGASVSGSLTATFFPPAVPKTCDVTYAAAGSKL
jgi:hypothetical protein